MRVLVLGASSNPQRYSNMVMRDLRYYNHEVVAVGRKSGEVEGMKIQTNLPEDSIIDTVTVYLSEQNQGPYMAYLKNLKPKRVIFNPGAENDKLAMELEKLGVECLEACTLVMLRTNQF
jgi:uncharacterized protein